MILGTAIQQPTDILDYDLKYDEWMDVSKEKIETVAINIVPDTGTLDVQAVIVKPGEDIVDTVKLWIQGGLHGEQYTVEITVTTGGKSKQDELIVIIEDFV